MQHVDKEHHRKSKMYSLASQPDIVHMIDKDKKAPRILILMQQLRLLFLKDVKFTYRRWLWHLLPVMIDFTHGYTLQ